MRILLVEDDETLAIGIYDNLCLGGYECQVIRCGRAALVACQASPPDLMILDLGLPDIDGLTIMERVRKMGLTFPILVLTARSSEIDVLKGFHNGADDYVTKPFSPRILLARVSALLGRRHVSEMKIYFGSITVDLATQHCDRVRLSSREFTILETLAQGKGEPISRADLLEEVWGMDSTTTERTVDTLIVKLRKKLEVNPGEPRFILTQRGIGYKLALKCFAPMES